MTQISRPQAGRQTSYPDAGGYTASQWARIFATVFLLDETTEGVLKHLSELAVSNPSGKTIRVASGAALCRGYWFANEDQTTPANASNVDFSPTTPAAARTDKVVLVENNTDSAYDGTADYGSAVLEFPTDLTDYESTSSVPAHSCRLAILTGVAGGAARSLTQDVAIDGDIWMIELARYDISSGGAVSSLTDYREYAPKMDTENLEDAAVTTAKLEADAVTAVKLADGAVTTAKIDNNAVTNTELADDAVNSDQIADGAIDTVHIADEQVTAAKIQNRTRIVAIPIVAVEVSYDYTDKDWELPDGLTTAWAAHWRVPEDFVSDLKVRAVVTADSAGDMYASATCDYGAEGESDSQHTASFASTAITLSSLTLTEITEMTLSDAAIGDYIECVFYRYGGNVGDTIGDIVRLYAVIAEYTSDS